MLRITYINSSIPTSMIICDFVCLSFIIQDEHLFFQPFKNVYKHRQVSQNLLIIYYHGTWKGITVWFYILPLIQFLKVPNNPKPFVYVIPLNYMNLTHIFRLSFLYHLLALLWLFHLPRKIGKCHHFLTGKIQMILTLKGITAFLMKKDTTTLETCATMNINTSYSLVLRKNRNRPEMPTPLHPKDGPMVCCPTSSTARLLLPISKWSKTAWPSSIKTSKAVLMSGIR